MPNEDKMIVTIVASDIGFTLRSSSITGYSINKVANYNPTSVMNRSAPYLNYTNSGPVDITFELEFKATKPNEESSSSSGNTSLIGSLGFSPKDLQHLGKTLLSLQYPLVSGLSPPPICEITIGLSESCIVKQLRCVCNMSNVVYAAPWDELGQPMVLTSSMSFQQLIEESEDAVDIAIKGDYDYVPYARIS